MSILSGGFYTHTLCLSILSGGIWTDTFVLSAFPGVIYTHTQCISILSDGFYIHTLWLSIVSDGNLIHKDRLSIVSHRKYTQTFCEEAAIEPTGGFRRVDASAGGVFREFRRRNALAGAFLGRIQGWMSRRAHGRQLVTVRDYRSCFYICAR